MSDADPAVKVRVMLFSCQYPSWSQSTLSVPIQAWDHVNQAIKLIGVAEIPWG